MPDLQKLLDQIELLDQEATKGPWTAGENDETGLMYFGTGYCDCCTPPIPSAGIILGETGRAEAEFIVLARTALPALSRAVRAVLELHKTRVHDEDPTSPFCNFCGPGIGQSCETLQAITDALEGDDDE